MTRTGSRKHANAYDSVSDSDTISSLSSLSLSDNGDSTSSGGSSDVEDGEVVGSLDDLEEREDFRSEDLSLDQDVLRRLMSEEEVTFDRTSAKIPEYSIPTKTVTTLDYTKAGLSNAQSTGSSSFMDDFKSLLKNAEDEKREAQTRSS